MDHAYTCIQEDSLVCRQYDVITPHHRSICTEISISITIDEKRVFHLAMDHFKFDRVDTSANSFLIC